MKRRQLFVGVSFPRLNWLFPGDLGLGIPFSGVKAEKAEINTRAMAETTTRYEEV